MSEVLDRSFRYFGIHRGELGAIRERSRWSAILPRVNGFFGLTDLFNLGDLNVNYVTQLSNQLVLRKGVHDDDNGYFGAILEWDLTNLVFHQEESPFGRYFKVANGAYLRVRNEVQRLFEERVRLLALWYTEPSVPTMLRGKRLLRLEELTAHLNAMAGGLYDRQLDNILNGNFERESRR